MHQLVQAGIALMNPDNPSRPTNSPKTVYQIAPDVLTLTVKYKTTEWTKAIFEYNESHKSLKSEYAKARKLALIPVIIKKGKLKLSPGAHNELIKAIIESFAPRFLHDSTLVYVGDTSDKSAYRDDKLIKDVKIPFDKHNKFPDVIFFLKEKRWLVLVESVTSHGPMDSKRYKELTELFKNTKGDLVFLTAFPNCTTWNKYASAIAWETDVWIADNPDHMIHYNGSRFQGPYLPN